MYNIHIIHEDITAMTTDCIVNAANSELRPGGGVCGAIFSRAGYHRLDAACRGLHGCPTGQAVITPGFDLAAKYIIHAVGPVWCGGSLGEPEQLYGCYQNSLRLAAENHCRSIAFPLISAGIYGYPLKEAWVQALTACMDFQAEHGPEPEIFFTVLSDRVQQTGEMTLLELTQAKAAADAAQDPAGETSTNTPRKTVRVVAAVIRDGGRIFATARGYGDYKGGWEFPGGKIEPGETPQAALKREIREELDTEIAVGDLITTVEYDYPKFHLSMDCFWCEVVSGDLVLKEAAAARWLTREMLDDVAWLPADESIIERIRAAL